MPTARTQREREHARQQRELQREAEARKARRKLIAIAVMCALMIIGVIVAVVIAATKGPSTAARPTTTTSTDPLASLHDQASSTSTPPTGPPASLPTVSTGAVLAGQAPCPAPDGSSPRTTGFSQPLPTCIQPNTDYNAVVHTSVGDLTYLLNQLQGAQTVNNFVVLARYHYWDGAPFTSIRPDDVAVLNNPVPGGPGFTLPNESPPQGNIFQLGYLAMVAGTGNTVDPGSFQIELGQTAADLPKDTPVFGLMLNGIEVLQSIRKGGSQGGTPTQAITITSIEVTPSAASTQSTQAP